MILSMLVEGISMRFISRTVGISIPTRWRLGSKNWGSPLKMGE